MDSGLIDFALLSPSKDTRIPVIAAIGDSVSRSLERLVEGIAAKDRQGVVVLAPGAAPRGWPRELRLRLLPEDELLISEGCLCCAMQTGLASALQALFLSLLRREDEPVRAVVLVSEAQTIDSLAATLKHAPFLGQRYRLICSLPLRKP
jgi:hypothetical protein